MSIILEKIKHFTYKFYLIICRNLVRYLVLLKKKEKNLQISKKVVPLQPVSQKTDRKTTIFDNTERFLRQQSLFR